MLYGIPDERPPEATIRVHMLATVRATLDGGCTIKECMAGEEYDLPEWLALGFFKSGKADPAEAHEAADGGPIDTSRPLIQGDGDLERKVISPETTEQRPAARRRKAERA